LGLHDAHHSVAVLVLDTRDRRVGTRDGGPHAGAQNFNFNSKTKLIMAQINAYLTFNGNCGEAFRFYQEVFGTEFQSFSRFGDMPAAEGRQLPETERDKIMHVALPISQETILMGSDTGEEYSAGFVAGNNISLSVNTDSKEEAD